MESTKVSTFWYKHCFAHKDVPIAKMARFCNSHKACCEILNHGLTKIK